MNIVIVGGLGKMGSLFHKLLKNNHSIRILEKHDWQRANEIISTADCILLSVPIENTLETIKKISPFLSTKMLLVDLTGVKSAPISWMLEYHHGPVLGLHPIFGPEVNWIGNKADPSQNYTIVYCQGRQLEQFNFLLHEFQNKNFLLKELPASEHDEMMISIQVIHYFSIFFETQIYLNKNLFLNKMSNSLDINCRNKYAAIERMFLNSSKLELYRGMLFFDENRFANLLEFKNLIDLTLRGSLTQIKDNFLKSFADIKNYLKNDGFITNSNETHIFDKDYLSHYFLLYIEVLFLIKKGFKITEIVTISSHCYLKKISAIVNLFLYNKADELANFLFTEEQVNEYQKISTEMKTLLNNSIVIAKKQFTSEYLKISNSINSIARKFQ